MALIFNMVKALLDTSFNINDDVLMMRVEQAYNKACGYCNQLEMPQESYNSIAFLCFVNISKDLGQNISAMSEGGRSVSFNTPNIDEEEEQALKGLDKWRIARMI